MKVASIVLVLVVAASAAPTDQFFPNGIDTNGFFGQEEAALFDHSSPMSAQGSASHPAVPQAASQAAPAAESIPRNPSIPQSHSLGKPPIMPQAEPLPKSNSIPKTVTLEKPSSIPKLQSAASKPKLGSPPSIKVPSSNGANPWVKPGWAESFAVRQKRRQKPLITPRAGKIALAGFGVAAVGASTFAIHNYFLHKQKEAKVGIVPVAASAGSASTAA